ncbi:hypothetical protein UL82_08550 [Corynebacterium kutscheri]|uniref:Uncharacterized protein n=1 Tax=Corynebacterium kutscheri TaxID=35755 RepID=A0A0F6R0R8_9CORY|nr:hypothetical protein [Corynebacterium kutscheri]AKE41867.1 hypothetical protein UL82_08550 [Corynebacterium kutscheri]VEH10195.1 Uncharacterised protein [Corynebacterium kutscheri]
MEHHGAFLIHINTADQLYRPISRSLIAEGNMPADTFIDILSCSLGLAPKPYWCIGVGKGYYVGRRQFHLAHPMLIDAQPLNLHDLVQLSHTFNSFNSEEEATFTLEITGQALWHFEVQISSYTDPLGLLEDYLQQENQSIALLEAIGSFNPDIDPRIAALADAAALGYSVAPHIGMDALVNRVDAQLDIDPCQSDAHAMLAAYHALDKHGKVQPWIHFFAAFSKSPIISAVNAILHQLSCPDLTDSPISASSTDEIMGFARKLLIINNYVGTDEHNNLCLSAHIAGELTSHHHASTTMIAQLYSSIPVHKMVLPKQAFDITPRPVRYICPQPHATLEHFHFQHDCSLDSVYLPECQKLYDDTGATELSSLDSLPFGYTRRFMKKEHNLDLTLHQALTGLDFDIELSKLMREQN